ncbi:N-6 DNA methylase [Amycolatopsis ultiminotia]
MATRVADAVDEAWHRNGSGGGHEVPVGVAATLSLLQPDDRPAFANQVAAMTPRAYWYQSRAAWTEIVRARTDLVDAISPMISWLFDEPDEPLRERVKATADAALAAGLLDLYKPELRHDADLLGRLLAVLKTRTEAKVNAQVYTPPDIADVFVSLTVDAVKPGQAICEPTVGTGSFFRATAKLLRQRSLDPASMIWVGADIDELALAVTGVNSMFWGLGHQVILYHGDTLARADWVEVAFKRRHHVLRLASEVRAARRIFDLM